jgi:transposase
VRLEVDRPRYRCADCRITHCTELDVLDARHRATKRLVDTIRKQAPRVPLNQLALSTGLAVNTIRSIAKS